MARLFLMILFLLPLLLSVQCDQWEYKLYNDLLGGTGTGSEIHPERPKYNPLERPVENNTYPVLVKLDVVLQQIVGVDEKNQIIEVNAWIKYSWSDYKLKWHPLEYGGITDLRFPVGTIWRPDVLLYNSVDPTFDSTYKSNLVVYSDGTVNWIPPGILKTSCKIDITWFPFDDQSCYLKFGSWTYHGFALDLQPEDGERGMDTSEYLANGEWLLLSTPVERSEKFYDCCPEPYPDVKFYINIRRRTLYYGFNLIIPSFLISLMTVLGFTLPPDAGEKITLEITILLSVCFFLSIVADMTPPTSEAVPLIGAFFTCCMLVVSASVVFTVVVLNLHYRTPDTHMMSPFVKTLLLDWIPWLLMMQRPGHEFSRRSLMQWIRGAPKETESESLMRNVRISENGQPPRKLTGSVTPPTVVPDIGGQLNRVTANLVNFRRESVDLETRINQCIQPMISNPGAVDPGVHAIILMMQRIHSELKFITKRMEKEDEDSDAENDWKFAAMVVDRLCLVVFSVFIIASTCGIMFSAPHLTA